MTMPPVPPPPIRLVGLAALAAFALPLWSQTPPPLESEDDADVVILSPFEIDPAEDRGYRPVNSVSASRLPVALRDTPLTLSVVTEELIRDLGANQIQDVLEYVSGVRQRNDSENAFFIRGQRVNYFTRNGFVRYDFVNTANVQRVEVIKGPAALLYGTSSPGGLINYVTKRPLLKAETTLRSTIGSYDRFEATVDTTGPIHQASGLAYRFIGNYQQGGSVIENEDPERYLFTPSFSFRPARNTLIFLEYEYGFKKNSPWSDTGRPTFNNGTRRFGIPTDLLPIEAGNAKNAFKEQFNHTFTAELVQRFGENWNLRVAYNSYDRDDRALRWNIDTNVQDDLTLRGTHPYWNRWVRNWDDNFQVDLSGLLKTGPFTHRLLFGGQMRKGKFEDQIIRFNPANATNMQIGGPLIPLFPITDVPDLLTTDQFDPTFWVPNFTDIQDNDLEGLYASDTISFWQERVHVLLGVRWTRFESTSTRESYVYSGSSATPTAINRTGDNFEVDRAVPQTGISVRVFEPLTVYFLRSESFNDVASAPQIQPDGSRVPPQTGLGYEFGVKSDLFGGRLGLNLVYFDTKRVNIAQTIPDTNPREYAIIGEQTTEGLEADIYVAVIDGLSLVANFQHTLEFATTGAINPLQVGSSFVGDNSEPDWAGSLFGKYTFQRGALEGFAFGGGMSFQTTRDVFSGTPAVKVDERPGFEEYALFFEYARTFGKARASFSLNVRNVTDNEYERAPRVLARPRTIDFSASVTF